MNELIGCYRKPPGNSLKVGGLDVGICVLPETIEKGIERMDDPDAEQRAVLLSELLARNHVHGSAQDEYMAALWTECKKRKSVRRDKLGDSYMGIPREEIPWFPTVDRDKCSGCGSCADFCAQGVFLFVDGKPGVVRPYECMIRNSGCRSICPEKAISFPRSRSSGRRSMPCVRSTDLRLGRILGEPMPEVCGPCCPGKPAVKRLLVGGQEIGISGFDSIIAKGLERVSDSDEEQRKAILEELKARNYVPKEAENEYLRAVWEEFRQVRAKRLGQVQERFGGIPREEINWSPTIDKERCSACGNCAEFCHHGVYTFDDEPHVTNPHRCVVSCTGCLKACPEGAISFPTLVALREQLKALKKKYGVLT